MALYLFYISVPSSASEMVLAIEAELQKKPFPSRAWE
jgi:hypothetical protein